MKKIALLLGCTIIMKVAFPQQNWFTLYTDSNALVKDACEVSALFMHDIQQLDPSVAMDVKTILNTTPYLIYYMNNGKEKTANLPLWAQVIPQQQSFFYEVAGGEVAGKNAFGLFFNGFYLPHELGHAFQDIVLKESGVSYQNEYFANTVAILWWRKHGRQQELKNCYEAAKAIWSKLPNPVPAGATPEVYFTENYEQASQNPYTYGYMQFKQFIQVYEDESLPDFDTFIKQLLKK
jgi:hypothetical protein